MKMIALLFIPVSLYLIYYTLKRSYEHNPYRQRTMNQQQLSQSEEEAKTRKRPTTETGRRLEAALEDSWWKGRLRNVPKDEWDELFDVISIVEDDDF